MLRAFIRKIWKVVNWPFLRTLPVTVCSLPLLPESCYHSGTTPWLIRIRKNGCMESKTPWAIGASRATFQPFVSFKMSTTTSIRCGSTVTISLQSWVLCYPSNITDATDIPLDDLPIDRYADIENLVGPRHISSHCRMRQGREGQRAMGVLDELRIPLP